MATNISGDVVFGLTVQLVLACGREGLSLHDAQVRVWLATHDQGEIDRRNQRRAAAGYAQLDLTDPQQIARAVLNSARNEREKVTRSRRGAQRWRDAT